MFPGRFRRALALKGIGKSDSARYYDPLLGRFISEDPARRGGGINFYLYTDSNPITQIDPFGLAKCLYSISQHTMVCQPNSDRGSPSIYGPNGAGAARLGPNGVFSGYDKCRNKTSCEYDRNGPIPPDNYKMNDNFYDSHQRFSLEPWPNDPISRFFRDIQHPRFYGLGAQLHHGQHSYGCINADETNPETMQQYETLFNLLTSEDGKNWLEAVQ